MKILHLTDIHLDHVDDPEAAGRAISEAAPLDAPVVLTGDISIATELISSLTIFWQGMGHRQTYYVLGNHDAWTGSIADTRALASRPRAHSKRAQLVYLPSVDVVELAPGVALCGVDGFYDGRCGKTDSSVRLNDWSFISELRGLHRARRLEVLQALADKDARRAEDRLRRACSSYSTVIFATHVPPFAEASLGPQGESSIEHLPWYVNHTLGLALSRLAGDFPSCKILVLCGHTHTAADVQIHDNLRVVVGAASYRHPSISSIIEVP